MITKDDLRFYREPHRVLEKGEDYIISFLIRHCGIGFLITLSPSPAVT